MICREGDFKNHERERCRNHSLESEPDDRLLRPQPSGRLSNAVRKCTTEEDWLEYEVNFILMLGIPMRDWLALGVAVDSGSCGGYLEVVLCGVEIAPKLKS